MKAKLNYTVRSTRAPGELTDATVPVIVDRVQPIDLETVVENCIDRGLIAGLKTTAAHGIAEGVAAQIAREFTLGRGVQFGQYFYGRPYLSGTVDSNGRLTSANTVNVRLYKGNAFKLSINDFSWSFDGAGDAVKVDSIYGNTSDAGGNTYGLLVPDKSVVINGRNINAAGDTNKVTFVEIGAAGGTPVEVTTFTAAGDGILSFAWPNGLTAGKSYSVTVSRTDVNGVTRTSSAKKVTVKAGATPPPPVVPAPTIDAAGTQGCEPGTIEAPGGVVEVTGSNLDTATSIDLLVGEDGAPVEDMELWQSLTATYDAEGGVLSTNGVIEDSAPQGFGAVRVTTVGGSATYPVQYTVH